MEQTLLQLLVALCNTELMENKTDDNANMKKMGELWIDLATEKLTKENVAKSEVKMQSDGQAEEQIQNKKEREKLEKVKQERIDQKYQMMIELLNYVFKDLTGESYAYKYEYSIKHQKRKIPFECLVQRYFDVVDDLNADMNRCTTMYRYIVMAYALKSSANVSKLQNELITLFDSFNRHFPLYPYQILPEDDSADQEHCKYRKTSETKREQLHNLYARIFKDIKEHPQYEAITKGFCARTETEALNEIASYSATDAKELLFHSLLKGLTEAYQKLIKKYMERLSDAGVRYYELAEYLQNADHILTEHEVNLIKFLFLLYDKYLNLKESVDLRNPENSQKWELITLDDRKKLLEYLNSLDDGKQTYLKYVGGFLRETTEDRYHRLVENLKGNYFYETEYLAKCIWETCRQVSEYALNPKDKRYQKLAASIWTAYEDCLQIELSPRCLTQQQFRSEVTKALKKTK